MISIAAVGDVHVGEECRGEVAREFSDVHRRADVLLLAGDLTRCGSAEEALVLAEAMADVPIPVVAVLGNHDHHADQSEAVRRCLESAGVAVLEGEAVVIDTPGGRLGVAGAKGFGGGFPGRCATEFGEPEMKAFVGHARAAAGRLAGALDDVDRSGGADVTVALLHYSPSADTLLGEPPEIHPFLGSYLLAEAIDASDVDIAIHGHAHRGTEHGWTAGGTRVRNVARPVIHRAYRVFAIEPRMAPADPGTPPGNRVTAR